MHKKLWGIALAGALCLNVVGVAPMQNASVQPAPKTVAPKEVERTFKTAELTEMKYKKVSALPSAAKSVGFTNQESLEDIKRVFGSTQSHSQVSKSLMPGVKKLLELVDEAIALFIKSTAVEHNETIKIEFKNEKDLVADDKESFIADLTFKKNDGKITVAVLISGKQPEDKVGHIRNLLTAILTDDTLWQRYGVKISVGAGVVLVGLVLGKLWLNKRAEAKALADEKQAKDLADKKAVQKIAAFKTRMTEMAEKIARSINIFEVNSDSVVSIEDRGDVGFVVASIVNDLRVAVPLSFDGLVFYLDGLNIPETPLDIAETDLKTYLIIPAQIFNGGKKVDTARLKKLQKLVLIGVRVLVFDEKLEMYRNDLRFEQYIKRARNALAEYGLEDRNCVFVCEYPDASSGQNGLVGLLFYGEYKIVRISSGYPCDNLGYAITCSFKIPHVDVSHREVTQTGQFGPVNFGHQNTEYSDTCIRCQKIGKTREIWGLTPVLQLAPPMYFAPEKVADSGFIYSCPDSLLAPLRSRGAVAQTDLKISGAATDRRAEGRSDVVVTPQWLAAKIGVPCVTRVEELPAGCKCAVVDFAGFELTSPPAQALYNYFQEPGRLVIWFDPPSKVSFGEDVQNSCEKSFTKNCIYIKPLETKWTVRPLFKGRFSGEEDFYFGSGDWLQCLIKQVCTIKERILSHF